MQESRGNIDHARFRALAAVTNTLAWTFSADGKLAEAEPALQAFTGLPFEQLVGDGWMRAVHPDDRARVAVEWADVRERRQPALIQYRLRRHDGEFRFMRTRAVPLPDAGGDIREWVVAAEDLTDAERPPAESRDRESHPSSFDGAHRASEEMHRFLAALAHELRNPLAPICNSIQILRLGRSAPEVRQAALDTIERQATHMVRLLDDLVDLGRLRSDRVELRRSPVSLATVIRTALETSRPVIDQGRHPVRVDLPPATLVLDADGARLAQALANVLHNAAKFSDEGQPIDVGVSADGQTACIEVLDSGSGMSRERLARAFDLFAQADPGSERAYAGLGIGLNVARRLVELHGGRIEAHSDGPGRGTRVTIRLPILRVETGSAPEEPLEPASASRRRVLVVDDNEDAARIVSILLEFLGHSVRAAHDGTEALRVGEQFRPDVVLLDIGMPGMSGYEVAARCRQSEWGRQLTLVALSGWGQESDRQKSIAAGFDHHLVKPAGVAALRAILAAPGSGSGPSERAA